jgi:hypothetical protein
VVIHDVDSVRRTHQMPVLWISVLTWSSLVPKKCSNFIHDHFDLLYF